ncbi:peptidase inhibitor family I36 protein [Streptomyces sp. NPDC050549]|uniref:peptidase inhibitor family I36 protein n=1 Tax=unclassified Streptomyces TaxID=2593676 RepID=UPI0005276E71|nr:peptidase inhibitor family I36 protein [Streptomyces sp. NRRL F-525]
MRSFRLAAALTATALAALVGLALPGNAFAADGHTTTVATAPQAVQGAAASAVVSPQAIGDCPSTYFCFWVNSGYNDGPGKFSGSNTNWGAYSHSTCGNGTWSDCASSGYNHGTSGLGVEVWSGTGYTGLSACLPKDWSNSNFANLVWPGTSTSFNDSISSNYWTSAC